MELNIAARKPNIFQLTLDRLARTTLTPHAATLAALFAAILCLKAVFLLVDSVPGYFLGDSATYLATAVLKAIPGDRSFVYGFLLRRIGLHMHSLAAVIRFQVLLSAVSAWLVSYYLLRFFDVRLWIAALLGLLCTVEPLQILMERYVMTENVATFLFAVYLGLVLEYVRRGSWPSLVAAQVTGILLVSIRLSFLPEVLLNSLLAPLISPQARQMWYQLRTRSLSAAFLRAPARWRAVCFHVCLSVLVCQGLLTGYKHLYGHLMKARPALLYTDGYFLLSDLLPMVKPEDYPIASQRKALFSNLRYDPSLLSSRLAEHWTEGEVCPRIENWWPHNYQGNQIASTTALNAIKRNPLGLVDIAWREFVAYFDVSWFAETLREDDGQNQVLSDQVAGQLVTWFNVPDPKGFIASPAKSWHRVAMPWYWVILCCLPLSPALLLLCRGPDRPLVVVIVAAALLFFEGATLTVERPNARYLTTAAWLVLILIGIASNRIGIARRFTTAVASQASPMVPSTQGEA